MKAIKCVTAIVGLACLATGCGRSCEGTWVADKSSDTASPIAHATFCGDGTFTANAEYGPGKSRAMSGHYTFDDGKLSLDQEGSKREYEAAIEGDTMTIKHSGKTAKMQRMKPRKSGMW